MQAEFHPNTQHGRNSGYALAGLTLVLSLTLFWLASQSPVGPIQTTVQIMAALLVPFAIYLGWQAYQFSSIRYKIEGHTLIIQYGRHHYTYNLLLTKSVQASDYAHVSSFAGLRWPGCFFGSGQAATVHEETIPATFFATGQLDQQILLETAEVLLGLSPSDPVAFAQAIAHIQTTQDPAIDAETILSPPRATILIDAPEVDNAEPIGTNEPAIETKKTAAAPQLPFIPIALNILVWVAAIIGVVIGQATAVLPTPVGFPEQTGSAAFWFIIPSIGLAILVVNTLLATRLSIQFPQLTYLLNTTSIIIQLLLLITLLPLFN